MIQINGRLNKVRFTWLNIVIFSCNFRKFTQNYILTWYVNYSGEKKKDFMNKMHLLYKDISLISILT